MSGWKLCPIEPSDEMADACHDAVSAHAVTHLDDAGKLDFTELAPAAMHAFDDMLKAAPTPPDEVLERMAEAFTGAYPYAGRFDENWRSRRIEAMRSALSAAGEA